MHGPRADVTPQSSGDADVLPGAATLSAGRRQFDWETGTEMQHLSERRIGAFTAIALAALLAPPALAHGGYYQGPKTSDGIPLPTGSPGVGVPALTGGVPPGMPSSGPAVTGRSRDEPPAITPRTARLPSAIADAPLAGNAWEYWWAVHRPRFVGPARKLSPLDITPSARDAAGPTTDELRDRALPVLRAALDDTSADVRASAALALGRARDAEAGPALRNLVEKDASPDVRQVALVALGLRGHEDAVLFLHGIAKDRKAAPRDRALAMISLGAIGTAPAVETLTLLADPEGKTLDREQPGVAAAALIGLAASGRNEAVLPLRQAYANEHVRPAVRAFALTGRGALGDREAIEDAIAVLLAAPQSSLRRAGAVALGNLLTIDDVRGVNVLIHAARSDRDAGTQSLAVLSLGGIRGDAVRDELVSLFAKTNDFDRPYRALALGLQGDPASAPLIRKSFVEHDHEESLQASYALALGLLADRPAVPLLTKEIGRNRRFWSPGYAAQALVMIGDMGAADELAARMVDAADPRLRTTLAVSLARLGDPRGRVHLRKTLLESDSILARASAAMGLGAAEDEGALDMLLAASRVGESRPDLVRAACVSAVGRLLVTEETLPLASLLEPHVHSLDVGSLRFIHELLIAR